MRLGWQRRTLLLAAVLVAGHVVTSAGALAQAQTRATAEVHLQRDGNQVLLNASLPWALPSLMIEALLQGVPVHFVADVRVLRARWYWRDEVVLQAHRFMRLSYQPLTRRWRLYSGAQPFQGQGLEVALANVYDTLPEALMAMQRIARWNIGDVQALPREGEALLQLDFRIDLSHFPRPLQIGVLGRSDWNLLISHRERLDVEALQ